MIEVNLVIVFLALIAAAVTDIRRREVPDWISYSLIAVALVVALAESIIFENPAFILKSLAGLATFFVLAALFYYSKLFAGGDAKLLLGIGAALGADASFLFNTMIVGGAYGLVYSFVLAAINFKDVKKELNKSKVPFMVFMVLAVICLAIALVFNASLFYFIAAVSIFSPLIYAFTLAVEKVSLIKLVSPDKLTEGDWLLHDITIKGKTIKADFDGLSKSDIRLIKKAKKAVKIKYGLPFVPVFLLAFIAELLAGNLMLRILGI